MVQLRVKDICKEKGISINALAESIGVAQPTLSRIINGKQTPALDTLERIAEALGVEVYELLMPSGTSTVSCPHCGKPIKISLQ